MSQTFRKDAPDATLSFTIPQSEVAALGGSSAGNEGLSALLVHSLEAGDFFALFEEARLSGNAGAWTFTHGSNQLPYEIVAGGLDQPGVTLAFPAPSVQDVDLSTVPVGDEFAVTYHVIAEAIDTVQGEGTFAHAFPRDPTNANDGISFETSGLTPVPEPGGPLLLAAGATALAAAKKARSSAASRSSARV